MFDHVDPLCLFSKFEVRRVVILVGLKLAYTYSPHPLWIHFGMLHEEIQVTESFEVPI